VTDKSPKDEDRLGRPIAAGVIRPGKGNAQEILEKPPLELGVSLLESLDEDREDRV